MKTESTRKPFSLWVSKNPQLLNWFANYGLGFCSNCVAIDAVSQDLAAMEFQKNWIRHKRKNRQSHG